MDIDGEILYRIGNICDTCEAMFSKYREAQLPLAPPELAELLCKGLLDIPQAVLDTMVYVLPKGDYAVGLLDLQPALVRFKNPHYYIWENSQPAHVPHEWWPRSDPMTPWWFAQPSQRPGLQEYTLYEAIFPLVREGQLNSSTLQSCIDTLQNNITPTALALSVVDERFVSGRVFDWRLIHFLLDGHHKMMAACHARKPITLLSFLNINESVASSQWLERAIQVRYQA